MDIFLFMKFSEQLLTRRAASEFTGSSHGFYHSVPLACGDWRGEGITNPENQLFCCRVL